MKIKNDMSILISSAFSDFRRNKVRTFLTSLGITIGVMSVVLLIALGIGLKNYISEQFQNLGANLVFIFPGNVFSSEKGSGGSFGAGFAGGADFDEKDYEALKKVREADFVVPTFMKSSVIETERERYLGYVQGTNEQVFELFNIEIMSGEFFTRSDVSGRTKHGVLGYTIAEELFGDPRDAVGKTVRVGDQRFRVIGVAKKKGDREMDTSLSVPYTSVFGTLNPDKKFFTFQLGTKEKENIETIKARAKEILLKRYNEDEFSVAEQTEILSTVDQIFSIVNTVLVAIGSISLLVGGIGIMNIMYATVTERTKEVGVRRAIGATERDILMQFLVESVLLSLIGGVVGLLLTTAIVAIVRTFFPAAISVFSVIITIVISSLIGIFFGVFPARRAAKLPPIEAIRYE